MRRKAFVAALIGVGLSLKALAYPLESNESSNEAKPSANPEASKTTGQPEPQGELAPDPGLAATIRDPGPDLANFPNSSYTLPEGGLYIEATPLNYYGASGSAPSQWNFGYLLRYGIIEDMELRLFSNGLTFRSGEVGTSPLAIDTKAHLWKYDEDGLNASVGIEAYVQPPNWLASSDFKQPLQFAATLLVDHDLPWGISMGWNVGFTRTQGQGGTRSRPTFQWAFQKSLTDDIAVFIQGYHNAATLPGVPASQSIIVSGRQTDVMGFGGQWSLNDRFALFGNINWGLTPLSPKQIALLGFAFAL